MPVRTTLPEGATQSTADPRAAGDPLSGGRAPSQRTSGYLPLRRMPWSGARLTAIVAITLFGAAWTRWEPSGVTAALLIGAFFGWFGVIGFTRHRFGATAAAVDTAAAAAEGDRRPPATGAPDGVAPRSVELAALAHDLRSPLVTLGSYLELLDTGEYGDLPDEARAITARSAQVVERLHSLVESAVLAAAERAATAPLAATELAVRSAPRPAGIEWTGAAPAAQASVGGHTDMNAVLADVTVALGAQMRDARATMVVAALPPVAAPRDVVTRVLLNLIGNAIAHGQRPGAAPCVSVTGRERGGRCEFVVRDRGPGFQLTGAGTDLDALFVAGMRGVTDSPGDGLGLHTVRQLVEAAGGRAWIDTEAEGGAVRFTLPAAAHGDRPITFPGRAPVAHRPPASPHAPEAQSA